MYIRPLNAHARINHNHPLASSLIGAWVFGNFLRTRSVAGRGEPLEVISGSPTLGTDDNGPYLSTTASDYTSTGKIHLGGRERYSAFTFIKPITISSTKCIIGEANGTSTPFAIGLLTGASGPELRTLIRPTGGGADVDYSSASVLQNGVAIKIGVSIDLSASGAVSRTYANGSQVASGTRPATWGSTASAGATFGFRINVAPLIARQYVIYTFSGYLSANNHAMLARDPWQLIEFIPAFEPWIGAQGGAAAADYTNQSFNFMMPV